MACAKLVLSALVLAVIVLAVACGGEKAASPGGAAGLTDPRSVPTTTPWATPPPVVYMEGGAAPVETRGGTYTVKAGDTASDIASSFSITVEELAAANGMTVEQIASLSVGQELVIPGQSSEAAATATPGRARTAVATSTSTPSAAGGTYVVQDGDYPQLIAEKFGITADQLMAANGITDPASLVVGQRLSIPTPTPSP